ncbi:MAG: hypothetical protein JWM02_2482 [Frankiales bacterium]|nr:hypothetical protein [Frankiales bacterium]
MMTAALDPSYGEAAVRKAGAVVDAGGPERGAARRRVPGRLIGLLVLLGLVTGIAAAQVRQRADDAGRVRRSLVADIQRQTRGTDLLAVQADKLRSEVQRVRNQALGEDARGRSAAAQVAALELATGGVAVHGPGLVVTLDDAPNVSGGTSTARGGQLSNGRIYDRDVQDAVNALWAAGAEAITVNGQRLTAQTAIRSAGEAVLVDFRPLSPPYVLRAVGNVDVMEPRFADGPTARRFTTWTSLYGIRFDATRSQDLHLPGAGAPDLRVAKPEGRP